ncbi:MAG: TlpA family protein disulfide reductase [Acidobacteriota bacterium]|nr:TlpA family protein disulfide reductase [Acidobacteriota bacterium]
MKKTWIAAAFLAVAAASFLLADVTDHVRKAPELSFSIPGKGQQTLSQYKGKVVALEFIFTTCPHCQAASRYMTQMQAKYGSRGLQVIDVAVNANADLLVENFAKDFQVNFPVAWTTSDQMTAFMGFPPQRYVVPQLALIDRKGFIHWQTPNTTDNGDWEKLMNPDTIREHIEQLLAQPASASSTTPARTAKVAVAKKAS